MTHRMTLRSNPRLFLLLIVLVAVPGLGVFLFLSLEGFIGLALLLGGLFAAYHIIQFLLTHLRSRIETSEEGVRCRISKNKEVSLRWDNISHAGFCHQSRQKPCIFLYHEEEDKLMIIPREFSNFDDLLNTIKERIPLQEFKLDEKETIQDWLRKQLHIEDISSDESETP